MRNVYPLFEGNRILKKEMLWSLRDYSFAHIQLEYQEYGQGLLRGCDVRAEDGVLTVAPGLVKCGRFICLLTEETKVSYEAMNRMQYLKLRVMTDSSSADYICYQMEFVLDTLDSKEENEFELCRFHLREGAKLRDAYTGFRDLETEYDTVNRLESDWGGLGGWSVDPVITRCFGESILSGEGGSAEDCQFAYFCLNCAGALPQGMLQRYLARRVNGGAGINGGAGRKDGGMSRKEMYRAMCRIVDEVGGGGKKEKRGGGWRGIWVD